MSTVKPNAPTDTLRGVGRRFLGAPLRSRTYKHLLYLLVAFPLGIAYFVGLLTGTAVGIGLLLTWVGLPILIVTLAGATAAAGVEAHLARRLVGVEAAAPTVLREVDVGKDLALPGDGFFEAVRRLVANPSTWTAVVLVGFKFVFGLVGFVAVTVVGSISAAMLAAPFVYERPAGTAAAGSAAGVYRIGSWVVGSLPEALAVAGAGAVVLLVGVNVLDTLAVFQARSTAAILRFGTGD